MRANGKIGGGEGSKGRQGVSKGQGSGGGRRDKRGRRARPFSLLLRVTSSGEMRGRQLWESKCRDSPGADENFLAVRAAAS